MPFGKAELVRALQEETDFEQQDIKVVIDALPGVLQNALRSAEVGDYVDVPGIVRLHRAIRAAVKPRKQYSGLVGREIEIKGRPEQPTVKPKIFPAFLKAVLGQGE